MAIESTTGLGLAVLTSKKGYTPYQAAQLHRGIIKHGFTKGVLQSDHETSLMRLVSTVATDLKLPTRVSPPYSHQSQGKVERFHRNLFEQLRATRLQWSKDLNIEPHMLPPESLPWGLGTTSQPLHTQQLPRALFTEDISLRELPLQLPLQHRALRRDSWRRQEHPDAEATSQKTISETSWHLAWP